MIQDANEQRAIGKMRQAQRKLAAIRAILDEPVACRQSEVARMDRRTIERIAEIVTATPGGCICDSGMPHEIGCPER